MTLIRRPPPFADLVTLRDTMEQFFDERFMRPMWPFDGERRMVALPGVKPEAVEVTITEDLVTISGSFEEEKEETTEAGYVHRELSKGAFSRSFSIPMAVKAETAKAEFRDGLLTLTLPKTEEVKPKHVKIDVK
jgi:HSP20 family protein